MASDVSTRVRACPSAITQRPITREVISTTDYLTLWFIASVTMPAVGFGTYQISGKSCESAVISAIQQGYRLIDTADM
eukprot:COSAG02_NODE_10817_length_1852_cov_1.786651_2_plen_78_part_00